MRVVVPDDIKKLMDIFIPYMIKNHDGTALVLRDDAPEEAIIAHRKYQEWWEQNGKR